MNSIISIFNIKACIQSNKGEAGSDHEAEENLATSNGHNKRNHKTDMMLLGSPAFASLRSWQDTFSYIILQPLITFLVHSM